MDYSGNKQIEEKIMQIVHTLVAKNKFIEFRKVYIICLKELQYNSVAILNALEHLQQQKRIIFDRKLIRDFILANDTRNRIYHYLKRTPGERFCRHFK